MPNTKNINVNVHRPPVNIPLGRQGENRATCVTFDCSGLAQLYGDGTAELLHELKDGTVYPVAVTQDGASVSWTVSASDTATVGAGRAELRWYVGDTLAKSAKFRTSVSSALADTTTETPPEPQQSWVDKVLQAAQEIKDGAISDEQLADAIAKALADASASGEFDGAPGLDGTDGGYYTPSVDADGNLNWKASAENMPAVAGANIKGPRGDTGPQGPQGDKGDTGATGAQGPAGADGVTPNIQIGAVETLAAGSDATASITGTPENPLLNLGIPKGADGTGESITDEQAAQIEQNTADITDLKSDLVDFDTEKINKEFLYEIDGSNEQLSGTKIMDVSGNGEIAKVVADSVYRDNLIPIPDIKENTVNGLTYSAVDGIVSVSGTASTYTLIDLGVNLSMMDGINNIGYKIFIFGGTMPSGVSIVLSIAINGYTRTITSTVQENASTGLVTFNGKNIGVSVNNGTAVDFKFGVVIIPVNTIPSKFSNGCKYIGESLDELLCLSNMWAFGNDVSKIFLNTVYRFKKNNLYGKSLFVAGDSVAYGYGSNNISFGEIIAKNNNMSLTKVAISGTTFAKRDGLTNSILEQVESIDKEYDYIIVEGGFNDYFQRNNGVSIGTMPKNMNSSRDDKTTYGALDSICLWLKQNYPASKILFVVPHKIMTTIGVIDSEFYPYLQAIRDVCEKYSIRYADIALKGGCTPFYQSFRDKYFGSDGIHPNLDGYKTFYVPVIESEMEMM